MTPLRGGTLALVLLVLGMAAVPRGTLAEPPGPQTDTREKQAYASCCWNLRLSIGNALEAWAEDHHRRYPDRLQDLVGKYVTRVPTCPEAGTSPYEYRVTRARSTCYLRCPGRHHGALGVPAYDSLVGLKAPTVVTPNERPESAAKRCERILKGIGMNVELWATDHDGQFPATLADLVPTYLEEIPSCPAAGHDTYSGSYEVRTGNAGGFMMKCQGHFHAAEGDPPNWPTYFSTRRHW